MAVSGVSTILQAVRVGRIGAGYVLVMGTSGAFIAICVTAIAEGGPAMLATLVVISSLFQFVLSTRLSLFRRILTPAVAGTVIMLIPVTVMPIIFGFLKDVPAGVSDLASPFSALATVLVIVLIALKAKGVLRLWAPVIGVVAGSLVAGYFGLYDMERVLDASWIGFPEGAAWPGLDLSFGPAFWALLPAFVFVTLVGAIETIGDSIAIQRVSWRRPRAVDFRAVQGTVAADGMGNLLSGLLGTVPNTTYSTSVAVAELTGVGARRVGVALGVVFIVLAFFPKALAVILAIPGPVAAAYIGVLLAMLFIVGMKIVIQDGVDYRKGLVAGIAFWVGVGFQNGWIFQEQVSEFAGGLLENGMTAGGLVAVLMTLFMELTAPRRRRILTELDLSALPNIKSFLGEFALRSGWDAEMANRLVGAAEETILTLLQNEEGTKFPARRDLPNIKSFLGEFALRSGWDTEMANRLVGAAEETILTQPQDEEGTKLPARRLLLTAHKEGGQAVLEFVASTDEKNLQDRIALLSEQGDATSGEWDVSLRLLRHLACSVRHQQYHDTDIVTVTVDASETVHHARMT